MQLSTKFFYIILLSFSMAACTKIETKTVPMQYAGLVYDASGHSYLTVTIGSQTWMAKNLATSKYANGDTIHYVPDGATWGNLANKPDSGAFCYPGGNKEYNEIYGKFYNYYAIADKRGVCPAGMHIPDTTAFNTLINTLSKNGSDVGRQLKATILWDPNAGTEGTNTSGFTALPAGFRNNNDGNFYELSNEAYFWSSIADNSNNSAYYLNLRYGNVDIQIFSYYKGVGFSVRCVKDN